MKEFYIGIIMVIVLAMVGLAWSIWSANHHDKDGK